MTIIDNIAYDLYIKDLYHKSYRIADGVSKYKISKVKDFIEFKDGLYKEYYDQAIKIIRKEKLKKINNEI